MRQDKTGSARLSRELEHQIVFFARGGDPNTESNCPGREALNSWPISVRLKAKAVLAAVAESPPHRFAGGGYWEAMKGEMSGWFEVRLDGPGRHHYRLFCVLDYEAKNSNFPLLVIIAGLDKKFRTTFAEADYAEVRILGQEYFSDNPRSIN